MVSTIGALIASMDRQSATVQQHVDAVKEYSVWRQLPRSLALRIRRFYEYYCNLNATLIRTLVVGRCRSVRGWG